MRMPQAIDVRGLQFAPWCLGLEIKTAADQQRCFRNERLLTGRTAFHGHRSWPGIVSHRPERVDDKTGEI